jgi:NAD(P)-dependent dehydrogenase (short-subunit alcohol dehydrogenase family)
LHERWHATGDFKAAKQAFIAPQPIGRIARAEEVADLAVYLAGADLCDRAGPHHRRRLDRLGSIYSGELSWKLLRVAAKGA